MTLLSRHSRSLHAVASSRRAGEGRGVTEPRADMVARSLPFSGPSRRQWVARIPGPCGSPPARRRPAGRAAASSASPPERSRRPSAPWEGFLASGQASPAFPVRNQDPGARRPGSLREAVAPCGPSPGPSAAPGTRFTCHLTQSKGSADVRVCSHSTAESGGSDRPRAVPLVAALFSFFTKSV